MAAPDARPRLRRAPAGGAIDARRSSRSPPASPPASDPSCARARGASASRRAHRGHRRPRACSQRLPRTSSTCRSRAPRASRAARSGEQPLRARAPRPRDRRLPRRRVRRHGHRAGAEERRSTMPASPLPAIPNTWPSRRGTAHVVMMLVGGGLRVALATTHLPLADVPRAITARGLAHTLRILDADLRKRFGIARPRILVAGLNPHGGEGGHLGREDIDVIAPASRRRSARASPQRADPGRHAVRAGAPEDADACSPCITTRACRCSSTRASAAA